MLTIYQILYKIVKCEVVIYFDLYIKNILKYKFNFKISRILKKPRFFSRLKIMNFSVLLDNLYRNYCLRNQHYSSFVNENRVLF